MTENTIFWFLLIGLCPLIGLLLNVSLWAHPYKGAKLATFFVWIGFALSLVACLLGSPFSQSGEKWGFRPSEISFLMTTLVLFISGVVHQFSLKYMAGDRNYRAYYLGLTSLTFTVFLLSASDHVVLFILLWLLSNLLLVKLMVHKPEWIAAKNSGILALKTFLAGVLFLSLGTILLAYQAESFSLNQIVQDVDPISSPLTRIALVFIIIAALMQSGAYPFHKWLLGSLNSPTPVSALMHAGLVNGGGLLLARFAPLLFMDSLLLPALFVMGVVTVIFGGIGKLLQTDIKRMLACSTMTQMGFMIMQCGLGLFSAALAHLCWHGLFKSYLFLKAGSTVHEKRLSKDHKIGSVSLLIPSVFLGALGAYGFMWGADLSLSLHYSSSLLILFSWVASLQMAYSILSTKPSFSGAVLASAVTLGAGILYGVTVHMIHLWTQPLKIDRDLPLHSIHILSVLLIVSLWALINIKVFERVRSSALWHHLYVKMLNACQPDPKTVTTSRMDYKF